MRLGCDGVGVRDGIVVVVGIGWVCGLGGWEYGWYWGGVVVMIGVRVE